MMVAEAQMELSGSMDAIIPEENFSGSYVCSMSTDVDLTLRDDLTANVQDYLSRIVDELHLISRWTTDCCRYMLVCQEKQKREHVRRGTFEQEHAVRIANSPQSLLFQTELGLLRQEMQRSQLELYQRCTSNIAYMQNSFRAEHEEQMNELQRRFDDKIRFFTQQTIEIIEKNHSESDARRKSVDASIHQLQKQLTENQTKLSSLEVSTTAALASLSNSIFVQRSDTVSCIRRVENAESSFSLLLSNFRSGVDESLHSLKAAHSQLSSKIQVVRLEIQENAEDWQRKLQQVTKHLQSRSGATGGYLTQDPGARMPSLISQRTTGGINQLVHSRTSSIGSCAQSSSSIRMRNDTLDIISSNSNYAVGYPGGVKLPTGAAALATPDCFLYAKAALPMRNGVSDTPPRKTTAPAISSRMYKTGDDFPAGADQPSPLRSPIAERTGQKAGPPAVLDNVLVIQQSVLSQPLGREDNDFEPVSQVQDDDVLEITSSDYQLIDEKQVSARFATAPAPSIRASIAIDGVTSTPSSPSSIASPTTSPRKFQPSRLTQQGGVSTSSSNFLRSPASPRPDSTRE